jgi:hypothetical protein
VPFSRGLLLAADEHSGARKLIETFVGELIWRDLKRDLR